MFPVDTTLSPHAKLRPIPLDAVTLTDSFWAPRLKTLLETTLPTQFTHIEQTGRLDNFRRAAGWLDTSHKGFVFNDSDVYKWLEAIAWSLSLPSPTGRGAGGEGTLTTLLNTTLPPLLAAQQPDGYLNTTFMFEKVNQRWTNLRDWHELYCAGHFIQAAIALHRSPLSLPGRGAGGEGEPPSPSGRGTGGEGEPPQTLLPSALHLADLICSTFGPPEEGPDASGKLPGVPGHQEIEIALVELYRLTRDPNYLTQAQYFLDARGHGLIGGQPYHQDHQPYRTLTRHAGHAVRALYMNTAAADLYLETGDPTLLDTLTRLWEHATTHQMYLTGGFGARHSGESFGDDYELPNHRAYAETCAAIASAMWNYRMTLITRDARYTDLLEHTLYNAVLPGLALDGQHYFYVNPLASEGDHQRQPWFPCACCPPNLARLLASLPGYFYSLSDDNALWIHLYAENTLHLTLPDGTPLTLEVHTSYPWDGEITLTTRGTGTFALHLRLPAWCPTPTLTLNDLPLASSLTPGAYHPISRTWTDGDTLTLHLPMPVRYLEAHPSLAENTGKIALQRGPLLYCLESADNPTLNLDELTLDLSQPPTTEHHPDLLHGLTTLHLVAHHHPPTPPWTNTLYRPLQPNPHASRKTHQPVTAIPYYAWANRTPGQMRVWMKAN